jgi:hypothetical protein
LLDWRRQFRLRGHIPLRDVKWAVDASHIAGFSFLDY